MKIAVACEGERIFQHFGRTEQFKVYDVENEKVIHTEFIPVYGSGHGALAGLLKGAGVDTLICGGIGPGAQKALSEAGIRLYGGVTGEADGAVTDLLAGTLAYNPCVQCGGGHAHGGH